jgi:Universal stress protein UspA and related nucleotide-binding proteins
MKVVIGIDGSECAQKALESVCSMPWRPEDEFTVLTVVEPIPLDFGLGALPEEIDACEEHIYAAVSELAANGGLFLKSHLPANNVAAKVLTGKAAEQIAQWAGAWDADLVIVGSHGRRGFQHFMLGSVAEEVLKRSPCSVEIIFDKAARERAVHDKKRNESQLTSTGKRNDHRIEK